MLIVKSGECFEGIVGTPTKIKTIDGEPLHVGDIVVLMLWDNVDKCYYPFEKDGYYTVVCMDDETSSYPPFYPFVMGIKNCCLEDGTITDGWGVKLYKKYNEIKNGDRYSHLHFEGII